LRSAAPEVPLDPPEEIFITCTTFRDGQQARTPYTVQQVVDLYDMEARLSGPNGVIRQCEFFLYSGEDRDAVARVLALGRRYPEVTSWIRANKNDLGLVKDLGLRETGILTSCSDYHIFKKLGLDRNKAAAMYLEVVREAVQAGITPRCHCHAGLTGNPPTFSRFHGERTGRRRCRGASLFPHPVPVQRRPQASPTQPPYGPPAPRFSLDLPRLSRVSHGGDEACYKPSPWVDEAALTQGSAA
jgi:hypothetical protein